MMNNETNRCDFTYVSVPLRGKYRGELKNPLRIHCFAMLVSVPLRGKYRGELVKVQDKATGEQGLVSVPLRGKYRGE